MLGKLMKHEFRAVGRIMLPLYGAWLVMSVLLGFTINLIEEQRIVGVIIALIYAAVTIAVIVLSIILIIQRFYKNLLGSEGYLMFTLPVSTAKHVWNKVISAAVWIVAGILMGIISVAVIMSCTGGIGTVKDAIGRVLHEITSEIGAGNTTLVFIELVVIALLIAGETALKIYASISAGHQWSNHRVLGAIIAFLAFGIIETILGNIIAVIGNSTDIMNRYYEATENMSPFAQGQLVLLLFTLLVAALTAVYYLVTYKLLQKRLNLE